MKHSLSCSVRAHYLTPPQVLETARSLFEAAPRVAAVLEEVAARAGQGKEGKEQEVAKEVVPSAPVPKVNRQNSGETRVANLKPKFVKKAVNIENSVNPSTPHPVPPVPGLGAPVSAGEDSSQGEGEEGQGDVPGQGGGGTRRQLLGYHLATTFLQVRMKRLKRLPDIARIVKGIFVSEARNALKRPFVLQKLYQVGFFSMLLLETVFLRQSYLV